MSLVIIMNGLCFNAQTHFYQPSDACMIKSHLNDALQFKTRTCCFEFFRELHIYPAVEHYILEALGASSHFQTCFGHTIMERVLWMIIVAFGDLTIVVGIFIKGLKYMSDHIQYIGLFALKINVRTSEFCFNKIQI